MILELEGKIVSEPGRVTLVEITKNDLEKIVNKLDGVMIKGKEGYFALIQGQWFFFLFTEES